MKARNNFTSKLRQAMSEAMQEALSTSQDGSFDMIIRKFYCEGKITKQLFMRLQSDTMLRCRIVDGVSNFDYESNYPVCYNQGNRDSCDSCVNGSNFKLITDPPHKVSEL